jgi:hypothetical protein
MAVVAKTKKQIVDDIILRVTQAKPSDDFEVPSSQIEKIVEISRDEFVAGLLIEASKVDGHFIDPEYVASEVDLALSAVTNSTDLKATIVQPILSVPKNDYGLIRVRLHAKTGGAYTKARKVDQFNLWNLENMEFSNPSVTSPVVHRKGQVLHFSGLTSGYTTTHDVYVDYVESMVGSDTDFTISGAHVKAVTEMAEETIRRELGIMIVDPVNDGDQNPPQQTIQTRR